MLKIMRKYQRSWIIKVIFGAIIVTFVLFFGYSMTTQREKPLAQVGPYKISVQEYWKAYEDQEKFYKMLTKGELDEKTTKEIKERVKEDLINKYVLLARADELGIKASNEEFAEYLNSIDAFKKDGKFNEEQYRAALRYQKIEPEKFEESWKRDRIIQKVAVIIQDTGTFFNEKDVWTGYVMEKGMVNLSYALYDPSAFRDKINIGEKELLDIYEREKSAYKSENIYHFKVLIVDEKSSIKDDAVYMDLLKIKDIETYGKEKGLPAIDLGDMQENDLIKRYQGLKIEDLREMKKKGEISRVVRSPEGKSYIFQLVDMTEGKYLDKTLALGKIRDKLVGERAKAMAKLAAEAAIKDKSFDANSETGFIVRNAGGIAGIGEIPRESREVLLLSETKALYEKPLEISGKYYIFSYKGEQAPDKREWEKEKESYTEYFTEKNRREFLNSFLNETRAKMKISVNEKAL